MSAPTPSSRPQYVPSGRPVDPLFRVSADARTMRIAPCLPDDHLPGTPRNAQRLVLRARSPLGSAVDVVARLGTAVTLAALLVVTATALGAVDGEPMPTGAADGRPLERGESQATSPWASGALRTWSTSRMTSWLPPRR
jgi:hypothetical protein